jgi:hypothetical protein
LGPLLGRTVHIGGATREEEVEDFDTAHQWSLVINFYLSCHIIMIRRIYSK